MNINILRYPLFGIAGGEEVDLNFSYIYDLPSYNDCINMHLVSGRVNVSIKPFSDRAFKKFTKS